MSARIYIIEDDPLQSLALSEKLTDNGYRIVGQATTAQQALREIPTLALDLVLVDINLKDSELDGVQIIERLGAQQDIAAVFISAFRDAETLERVYAQKPVAYLSKPYKDVDLVAAIKLALMHLNEGASEAEEGSHSKQLIWLQNNLFIKTRQGFEKVEPKQLRYLIAKRSYSDLYTSDHKYEISLPLKALVEKLGQHGMVRVHRSYAINVHAIERFNDREVVINGQSIPLSANYSESLKDMIRRA